jgi:hypothetical protein
MKYFEKISKEEKKKTHKLRNVGVGVAGLAASGFTNPMDPSGVPARKVTSRIVKNVEEIDSKKLMDYGLEKSKKLGIETTVAKGRIPQLGDFHPGEKKINISKNMPDFLMHEVGHASIHSKIKNLGKIRAVGMGVAPVAALATAFTDKDSTVSKVAPYAAGAAVAPTLLDEGVASVKAVKDLKRAGATRKQLNIARKNLGKGFATYGAAAASLVAVPALIRKFKKSNK